MAIWVLLYMPLLLSFADDNARLSWISGNTGGKGGQMNRMAVIGAVAIFLITLGAGVYAQGYGQAEMFHFRVAVPAGTIVNSTTIRGAGAPVAMAPIIIDLQQRGLPRYVVRPDLEAISTHTITNVGKKPVRIRMELTNLDFPVEWDINANHPYDPASRTFTEPLLPGQSIKNLGADWFFYIPAERLHDPVVYNGGLKLTDADTGELLTFLPIQIVNGKAAAGSTPLECCL